MVAMNLFFFIFFILGHYFAFARGECLHKLFWNILYFCQNDFLLCTLQKKGLYFFFFFVFNVNFNILILNVGIFDYCLLLDSFVTPVLPWFYI